MDSVSDVHSLYPSAGLSLDLFPFTPLPSSATGKEDVLLLPMCETQIEALVPDFGLALHVPRPYPSIILHLNINSDINSGSTCGIEG